MMQLDKDAKFKRMLLCRLDFYRRKKKKKKEKEKRKKKEKKKKKTHKKDTKCGD